MISLSRKNLTAARALALMLCAGVVHAQSETLPLLDLPEPDRAPFSFIVHGDLTGGEREGVFASAAKQFALFQPDFVISVGDLIEGDSKTADGLHEEWQSYEARAKTTGVDVYLVGGNHDLTNALQREVWNERYGRTYYHFVHEGALFLVLDTEDYSDEQRAMIDSARNEAIEVLKAGGMEAFVKTPYATLPERTHGAIGDGQLAYFRGVLEENPDAGTVFLFTHKSPWGHPGNDRFRQLETALASRDYTVFHGHEHAAAYEQRLGHDYIRLATTGGTKVPSKGRAEDHFALVTVGDRVTVTSIDLAGVRDKRGESAGDGSAENGE